MARRMTWILDEASLMALVANKRNLSLTLINVREELAVE